MGKNRAKTTPTNKACFLCQQGTGFLPKNNLVGTNVEIYFLLRHLLGIPPHTCANYLREFGHPSNWVTLCYSCSSSVVDQGIGVFKQIKTLEEQLDSLRTRVRDLLTLKRETPYGDTCSLECVSESEEKIRTYFLSTLLQDDDDNGHKEDEEGMEFEINPESSGCDPLTTGDDEVEVKQEIVSDADTDFSEDDEDEEYFPEEDPLSDLPTSIATTASKTQQKSGSKSKRKNRKILNRDEESNSTTETEDSSSSSIPPKYPCSHKDCSEVFKTARERKQHFDQSHKLGFRCLEPSCNTVVRDVRDFEHHHRVFHMDKSSLLCLGCNVSFKRSVDYRNHLKSPKLKIDPSCIANALKCPQCKNLAGSKDAMDIHIRIFHKFTSPFKCPTCEKGYPDQHSLDTHLIVHGTSRPFICELCGGQYFTKQVWRNHVRTVHLNKEPGGTKYPCRTCSKVYLDASRRNRHEQLHTDSCPFVCSICNKAYKTKNYLNIHQQSHNPDRHVKYAHYRNSKYNNEKRKEKEQSSPPIPSMGMPTDNNTTIEKRSASELFNNFQNYNSSFQP